MESNSKNTLKKNVIINSIYEVLIVLVPFITAPYLSRVLGPAAVGTFSYTHSLISFFVLFSTLGTVSYGKREIAKNRDDKNLLSKTFWEIEFLTIITSSICLLVWFVISFFYQEYQLILLIFGFLIVNSLFDISWLYVGIEKVKYTVLINALMKICSVVAIFIFVKSPSDLWVYVLIYSCSALLGSVSMWLFLPRFVGKSKVEIKTLKIHFKETLVYFIPTIATTIYAIFDKTLIGLLISGTTTQYVNGVQTDVLVSTLENGYYEQATKIISMLKTIGFYSINGVLLARASYLAAKNDENGLNTIIKGSLNFTLFLTIGFIFGLLGISDIFVPVFFGEGYEKSVILINIFTALLFFACINHCLTANLFIPIGKRKETSYFVIIGTVVNILLNIPLILLLRSVGAAISSVIAEIIIFCLNLIYSKKYFSWKTIVKVSWKKIVAGLSMFLLILGLKKVISIDNDIIKIIIIIACGGSAYVFFLFLLRDSSFDIFKQKMKNIGRKKKRTSFNSSSFVQNEESDYDNKTNL